MPTDAPLAPAPTPPRRLGCWGALLGSLVLLAGLAGFVFYRIETFPGRVRDAFAAVAGVQPQISVREQVVYEQTHPVLELAVVERQMVVERETTNRWLGSTKRLRVRGVYRAKAGFDLSRPVSANIRGNWNQSVQVHLPPPRLLSVELQKLDVLTYDNGLWNHVRPEEFTQEVEALNIDARLKAGEEGLMAEAKRSFTEQLRTRLGPEHPVEVSTAPLPATVKP